MPEMFITHYNVISSLHPGDDEDDEDDEDEDAAAKEEAHESIQDLTQTNLVNLRRTIYLTIMSSLDFEECAHKLCKIQLLPGQEVHAYA